jgi:hypothetical protein
MCGDAQGPTASGNDIEPKKASTVGSGWREEETTLGGPEWVGWNIWRAAIAGVGPDGTWLLQKKRKKMDLATDWAQMIFRAEIHKAIGRLQKYVLNWFKYLISKSRDLNIFKHNLNWIQNRIKSNKLFGNLSNLEIEIGFKYSNLNQCFKQWYF